ncbi:MAG TPA: hypothetical protein VG944_08860 [Fimbriimonas sp.]|nr:hypothetical protein [Fimbriimonas sp.]
MPAKNIECQLVQGQIVRYLKGDRFSAEAMKHLEAHLAECEECSEIVDNRRKTLLALLGDKPQAKAVVETEKEEEKGISPRDRLVYAIAKSNREAHSETETAAEPDKKPAKRVITKPMLYAGGLAVVLIGMSYFSRGAVKMLGPMAAESPIPAANVKPASRQIIPKPIVLKSQSHAAIVNSKPLTVRPAPVSFQPDDLSFDDTPAQVATPKRHLSTHRTRHRRVRKLITHHTRPHRPAVHSAGVRVYDPEGKPLQ